MSPKLVDHAASDGGRRVVQCACGRSRRWSDAQAAITQGWHRVWTRGESGEILDAAPIWQCSDCWTPPPRAVTPKPPRAVPAYLWDLLERGLIAAAIEQLTLSREGDPERFAAMIVDVCSSGIIGEGRRLRIASYFRRHGVDVAAIPVTSIKPRQKWHLGAALLRVLRVEWIRDVDQRLDEVARCLDDGGAERLVSCGELLANGTRHVMKRGAKKAQVST